MWHALDVETSSSQQSNCTTPTSRKDITNRKFFSTSADSYDDMCFTTSLVGSYGTSASPSTSVLVYPACIAPTGGVSA